MTQPRPRPAFWARSSQVARDLDLADIKKVCGRKNYWHATKFEGIDHASHRGAGATPHVVTMVSLSITVALDRSKTQY